MKIVRAVQTSSGCPSQWDAWDDEDNYYYLRYRHGRGTVIQYKTENWVDAPDKKPYKEWGPEDNIYNTNPEYIRYVTSFEYGDPMDGFIELDQFCELAGIELDLIMYTGYGDHLRDQLVQEGMTFLIENEKGTD
jgi:hypothetical protein